MAVLARASTADMAASLRGALPEYRRLRGPEVGLAMLRGRAGGDGAPFNLGEMSVTRCTVRTADGFTGRAYIAGRDEAKAELAALLDALLQDSARHDALQAETIAPLREAQQRQRDQTARKAAATRVDFFAMATMRTTA